VSSSLKMPDCVVAHRSDRCSSPVRPTGQTGLALLENHLRFFSLGFVDQPRNPVVFWSSNHTWSSPKINPPPDNFLQSTLKRKGGPSKVLTHTSKKRIDTKVINVSDMVGVLASAFQVLTLSLFSSFPCP
jgi:hypothetical protein